MIVDLDTVKKHLKLDPSDMDEDTLLTLYMQAAEQHIMNYIDGDIPGSSDSPQEPVPFPLKAAQLLIIGDMYENRQGASDVEIKPNPAVTNLLYPYRQNLGV